MSSILFFSLWNTKIAQQHSEFGSKFCSNSEKGANVGLSCYHFLTRAIRQGYMRDRVTRFTGFKVKQEWWLCRVLGGFSSRVLLCHLSAPFQVKVHPSICSGENLRGSLAAFFLSCPMSSPLGNPAGSLFLISPKSDLIYLPPLLTLPDITSCLDHCGWSSCFARPP